MDLLDILTYLCEDAGAGTLDSLEQWLTAALETVHAEQAARSEAEGQDELRAAAERS
jgi:hypothetical protein